MDINERKKYLFMFKALLDTLETQDWVGPKDEGFEQWRMTAFTSVQKCFGASNHMLDKLTPSKFLPTYISISGEENASSFKNGISSARPMIKSAIDLLEAEVKGSDGQPTGDVASGVEKLVDPASKRVFIVHGHDVGLRNSVELQLRKIGLEPIVLQERPNSGQTIVEKFERETKGVSFAIVLLTPDDVATERAAYEADSMVPLRPRARENVILECGYLIARLRRERVMIIRGKGVELPSDLTGMVWVSVDEWEEKLRKELAACKVPFDKEAYFR